MEQTAVEQFLNAIKDQINLSEEHLEMIESYASQAKEMEKQQIVNAYKSGRTDVINRNNINPIQYHNETFNNK